MMRTFWEGCLFLIAAYALGCVPASAEKRVALIIGNGAYSHKAQLANPVHDAEDVATALKRTNFEVIFAADLGQAEMQDAAINFSRAARNADVALFYYSGHAMQFNGINYLMPIDAKLDDEADLKRFIRVDDIMNDLQQAKNLRILVLDSCRDNPFAESLKRSLGSTRSSSVRQGLSKMDAPLGTAAFLKRIEEPEEIGDVFRDISSDVYETSGKSQLPELSLSIAGKFYLNGPVSITVTHPAQSASTDACSAAEAHWKAADAIGTVTAYEDHIAKFPRCAFIDLAKSRVDQFKQKAALTSPAGAPPGPARRTGKFDGKWDVTLTCPNEGDVLGYSRYLTAVVDVSIFHAEDLKPGQAGWLTIDGEIAIDGKAAFVVTGLTGVDPRFTLGHTKRGMPYNFPVDAQFNESRGTGKRLVGRPCNLLFGKR